MWALVVLLVLLGCYQIWAAWEELKNAGMDLQQDYLAALRLRAGGDIFAPFSSAEVVSLGVQEHLGFGMRENVHPPLNALLFALLTLLPFPSAALVWTLICVAVLLLTINALINALQLPITGAWRAIVLLLLLNWYPVWLHLHLGQITIILFGLIVGAWLCLRRGRDGIAGALLAVAALLKMYPAFLLGYALFQRRWRTLWAATLTVIALVTLQMTANSAHWFDYFTQVAPQNADEWGSDARNASLQSISMRLFVGNHEVAPLIDRPQAELPWRIGFYAITLGIFVWALWQQRGAQDLTGAYSMFLSAMVLLSPLSWEHSYILLLLPLGYVWSSFQSDPHILRRWPVRVALLTLALSMCPAEIVLLELKGAYLPERIPGLFGMLAPGVFVLIGGFASVVLATEGKKQKAKGENRAH
jgi:hypothetical protein